VAKKTAKGKYNSGKHTKIDKNTIEKRPVKQTGEVFYDKYPSWAFKRFDFEHPKWGMSGNIENIEKIFKYLTGLEGQKWNEILFTRSGRNKNTRNHYIEMHRLAKNARDRAVDIKADEFDGLYSLALQSRLRVWGHIDGGVFFIIWIDPDHKVYPVD